MNYNMEDIQCIAQAVAKLVQADIHQEQTESKEAQTMAEFELAFREALRQIGAEAIGIFLSELQQTPESEIACECGGRQHYQRMRPTVTTTVFGKVEYIPAYYAGCWWEKAWLHWTRPMTWKPVQSVQAWLSS